MKPRRSILSVPGHVEKMHHKASKTNVDVIMLDMEDSVPVNMKEEARKQIIQSLMTIEWGNKTLSVRINSLDTAYGYRDLLEIGESAGHIIDSIVIPKVNHPGDIYFADKMLGGIEINKGISKPVGIEASIETAGGLENVTEIAGASSRIVTLVFGIADYSASVGARLVSISGHGEQEDKIYPGHRWHFALSRIVMAAKARGIMAIDAPFGNFKDPEGLRGSGSMACAIGCDGKWVIHPDQIDIINQVFSPCREDIDRAVKILEAFNQAQSKGRGAVAVEGRMVDQATVHLAKQLYDQARYLKII
ncbi:HpcH/HpaI aldolase/Cytrate lyase family protein [Desulfonema limicola]|uniref:HpcH/HpaI aldolase/Cytrate lyase family protein n=1 Tax=Desulfonema limicola TaxID=45656 RepID=A0A975B5A2_9BACT|nr:CoA ester lyase [Desulfonema limicola]QTA78999.1 HpcH/HpaI aldolase/Cytrate lyase family protein [Desulfonema limicola]